MPLLNLLASVKLAVVVILSLIIASIVATLYPFLNVFQTFWFRGLLLIFSLNLFFCTITRIKSIFRKVRKKPEGFEDELFYGEHVQIVDLTNCEKLLDDFFKEKRYRVGKQTDEDKVLFLAQKGFPGLIAPHFLHLSLIVVLIGAFIGTFGVASTITGFVGQKKEMPVDLMPGVTLEINGFKTLYDEKGHIDNWVSEITLYQDGKQVASGSTRVNYPFKYKGVVFYQNAYGYNHLIEITGEQEGVYSIPDGKTFQLSGFSFNIRYAKDQAVIKVFEGSSLIQGKILGEGENLELSDNTTIEYLQLYPYTILGVKKDPGANVVMLGFLLMTISSTFFWMGRYREVRAVIDKRNSKLHYMVSCKNQEAKAAILKELKKRLMEV